MRDGNYHFVVHSKRFKSVKSGCCIRPVSYTHLDVYKRQVQNWGLMGVPLLIGWVLNTYCKGPVVDGAQTYDYTLPMAIFACFGVLALIVALMLKAEDKKKGYGLQEANCLLYTSRIAVLALNPHAGDDGLLGTEEQEIISPAIQEMAAKGILCYGPYPADGFMGSGNFTHFDGVLAMYHDQGLAPFKALAMDEGVNYTAGLPVIRTSPAHGTA